MHTWMWTRKIRAGHEQTHQQIISRFCHAVKKAPPIYQFLFLITKLYFICSQVLTSTPAPVVWVRAEWWLMSVCVRNSCGCVEERAQQTRMNQKKIFPLNFLCKFYSLVKIFAFIKVAADGGRGMTSELAIVFLVRVKAAHFECIIPMMGATLN